MKTNVIRMVALIDPATMDHVNDCLQEGVQYGELNISLPDTDQTIRGSWELQCNDCLSFNLFNNANYEMLESSFNRLIYRVDSLEELIKEPEF